MDQPHRGFNFVHVLPALAPGAKRIDLNVGRVKIDRFRIRNFRNDVDAGERGVPALVGIERRDANEPMHSQLWVEMAVGIIPLHQKCGGFDPDLFAHLHVDRL